MYTCIFNIFLLIVIVGHSYFDKEKHDFALKYKN